MVFAGYGLQVPEAKHDDLAGLDVKGKVVLLLTGGPSAIPRSAPCALSEHPLGLLEAGGRDRRRLDPKPEGPGHSVGPIEARALSSVDGIADPQLDETAGPAACGDAEPGDR